MDETCSGTYAPNAAQAQGQVRCQNKGKDGIEPKALVLHHSRTSGLLKRFADRYPAPIAHCDETTRCPNGYRNRQGLNVEHPERCAYAIDCNAACAEEVISIECESRPDAGSGWSDESYGGLRGGQSGMDRKHRAIRLLAAAHASSRIRNPQQCTSRVLNQSRIRP